MTSTRIWRALVLALTIALTGLCVLTANSSAVAVEAAGSSGSAPVVVTENGAVRGVSVQAGLAFRGLPYAAPPVGELRWKPPEPAASWSGIRDGLAVRSERPAAAGAADERRG